MNGRFLNARNWFSGQYVVSRELAMYSLFAQSMELGRGMGVVGYMSMIIVKASM